MLIVTLDLDWAPEPAIEETLDYLSGRGIVPTVFATHESAAVMARLDRIEVGLHPFFHTDSSQGKTIEEVVEAVLAIPHNVPAFRCHRYGNCNISNQLMAENGMRIASNICTDLEIVPPFKDRMGLLQVPIFFEDGGYLWRHGSKKLSPKPSEDDLVVINIHPMHFAINTPAFDYMVKIKQSLSRTEWQDMGHQHLDRLKHRGVGIREVVVDLLDAYENAGPLVLNMEKSPRFSTKMGNGK